MPQGLSDVFTVVAMDIALEVLTSPSMGFWTAYGVVIRRAMWTFNSELPQSEVMSSGTGTGP